MRYVLLGPIAVIGPDGPRPLAGPKQRAVLAALLLRANQVVSDDQLCALVWGTDLPANARAQLQVYMSNLRKVVGRDTIDRQPPGYKIHVQPDELDLHVFTTTVEQAATELAEGRADSAARLLRQALQLWAGPALGGAGDPLLAYEGPALEELRLSAYEQLAETGLALGEAASLIGDLSRLVHKHPFRERLGQHLMLALHAAGRTTEALAAYSAIRARLSGELGIDPGPRLRQAYQRILRGDDHPGGIEEAPRTRVVPAQLPHATAGFVGRETELRQLHIELQRWAAGDEPPLRIWVLHGPPGVGKTALATQAAHATRRFFPDGQLYLDLHGHDPHRPPLAPADALRQLLRSVGAGADHLPGTTDEQAQLLRSLLAGRRVLILLDGARSAEQVRPLLPGRSAIVLVTSRHRLDDLVARDGADSLAVEPMPVNDTVQLLRNELGDSRTDAAAEAVRKLAEQCDGLPLAARIAAANIAARGSGPLDAAVTDLTRDGLLEALTLDGASHISFATAAATSYAALPEDLRRLFRRLGLLPNPQFTSSAATAVDGGDAAATRRRLRGLAAAGLLRPAGPDHYRMHRLLHLYAQSLSNPAPAAVLSHPRVREPGQDIEGQPEGGGRTQVAVAPAHDLQLRGGQRPLKDAHLVQRAGEPVNAVEPRTELKPVHIEGVTACQ